jgi:hypothetical protein
MRRRLLIALLALGTVAGYSSGFASLYRWHRYGHAYGGHCRQGRAYDDDSFRSGRTPWAPARDTQAPQGQQPQAQAPQGQQVQ